MLSTEAKVGAVTVAALLLLVYLVISLGHFSLFGDKGYPVYADFNEVQGLKSGNVVRYAGVEVGQVKDVNVTPQGVRVHMLIQPGVNIPVGSRFTIGTDGLLGEKYIEIIPPAATSGYLSPGAVVRGEDPQGLEHLIAAANATLADVQKLVASLNAVVGDPAVQQALRDSALNLRSITANLDAFSGSLARLAAANEGQIGSMVDNLTAMSQSLSQTAARLDQMTAQVDNNGQTAADLRDTLHSLQDASARVARMAAALEPVVTDPQTAQNLRETLNNARAASAKADKLLSRVGDVQVNAGVEALYGSDDGRYITNGQVRIGTGGRDFALIGVNDIGGARQSTDFQVGRRDGAWDARAGVVNGKAGAGVDMDLSDAFRLSLDVYDPNEPRVKLRGQYQLAPDTFFVAASNDLAHKEDPNTYFGVRRSF